MMRVNRGPGLLLSASFLVLAIIVHQTDGLAVMSVDLGSEFMKVAIVKPGVPMEIALNKESRRKTPAIVAMRNGERTMGDEALNTAVKYPKLAYAFLQCLIGKDMDHPQIKQFQERYPYYNMERDYATGMPIFVHEDGNKFSVDELFAMLLENARETAESFAEQPISEAVITIPPFFNQAERRAVLRAADITGLKVLQLMTNNAAVALNYGVFRSKSFNKTATHYMFVDVGSGSTTATVVAYQTVDSKNPVTGIKETNPQVTVKGVGFDRTLGGVEFQLRLRNHLAKLFDKSKKTKLDLYSNDRAMAKLFKEAGRLMKVLSANNAHMSQIEGLLDDEDFKAPVTRAEFEEMCADLFDRVAKPVLDAYKSSEVTWDEINEVILMGGGTRIPKIQEMLLKTIGKEELGKSINTDEAAALGAVYQAAHLSKGFKVKKFIVKDANLYPIQVEFERAKKEGEDAENIEESKKLVKRTLFGFLNPYPQKKVMTFNKHVTDFTFEVNYGEPVHFSEDQMKTFGNRNLQKITLKGVAEAMEKHASSGTEPKGVKAHFRMDESGVLLFEKAESLFERSPDAEPEEESTLSKLGNFFFGGSEENDKAKTEESTDETKDTETDGEKKEEIPSDEQKKETDEANKTEEASEGKKADEKEPEKSDEKSETESDKESDTKPDDSTNQGSDKAEEKTEDQEKKAEGGEEEKKDEPEQKDGEKKQEDKEKKTEGDKDDKKEESKDGKKDEKKEEEKKKEQKPKTMKEQLKSEYKLVDISDPNVEQLKASKKLIKDLKKKDEEKLLLAKATNDLESFIINTRDKLYQEDYEKCSTDEERTEIQANLSAASDWLYEQDETVERKVYEEKLKDLKKMTKKIFERVSELQERPKALEALNSIMNYTEHFLVGMQNYTGENQPFTEIEYTALEKLINETKEWNKTQLAEQAKTKLTEKPKMAVEDIAKKINELDREVKYLISKAKYFKPKPKTPTTDNKKSNKTKSANKTINVNETKIDDEPVADDKKEEKAREPVADGATDAEQPTDAPEEEIKLDIPPMPGSEEEAEAKKKEKQKKKEKGPETEGEEEPLQLDAADDDGAAVEGDLEEEEIETSTKKSHHGHDPDDEL